MCFVLFGEFQRPPIFLSLIFRRIKATKLGRTRSQNQFPPLKRTEAIACFWKNEVIYSAEKIIICRSLSERRPCGSYNKRPPIALKLKNGGFAFGSVAVFNGSARLCVLLIWYTQHIQSALPHLLVRGMPLACVFWRSPARSFGYVYRWPMGLKYIRGSFPRSQTLCSLNLLPSSSKWPRAIRSSTAHGVPAPSCLQNPERQPSPNP
jgi:hypothetical protein